MHKLPWCNVILFSAWFYKPAIVIQSNFDWLHWSFSCIFFGTNIFEKKGIQTISPGLPCFKKIVADNHMTTVLPLVTFVNMHLTCLTVVVCMKVRFKSKVSEVFLSFKASIYQDGKIYFVAYICGIFKYGKSCLENINNKACDKWMTINKIPTFLNPWHFNLNPWHRLSPKF